MLWRFRIYLIAVAVAAADLLFAGAVGMMLPEITYASGIALIAFFFTALVAVQLIPAAWADRYVRRPVRYVMRR